MSALAAIFLARLSDPIGALIALTIGAFGKSKWIIAIGGIATTVVMEVLLRLTGKIDEFQITPFVLGIVAFALWSALGHLVFRRMMGRASK